MSGPVALLPIAGMSEVREGDELGSMIADAADLADIGLLHFGHAEVKAIR